MNKNSIIKKVAVAIIIPLVLQAILFMLMISGTGIIPPLRDNIINGFKDRGNDKHKYIQDQMLQNWSSINRQTETVNKHILRNLEKKGLSTSELNRNVDLSNEILKDVSKYILGLVKNNYTTDIFIILDTKNEGQENIDLAEKEGIYIKDTAPLAKSKNNLDLHLERGPLNLVDNLEIGINSQWENKYILNKGDPNNDFFYEPINETRKCENRKELGYWGKPAKITDENNKVITYSVPLINREGDPYGVVGIGIDLNYINKILNDDENSHPNTYSIMIEDYGLYGGDINIDKEVLKKYKDIETKSKKISDNTYKLENEMNRKKGIYFFKKELNLNINDSVVSDQKWYVVSSVTADKLFYPIYIIIKYNIFIMIISTLVAILIAYLIIRNITKPIRYLAEKVRQSNPRKPLKLDKINISEIDNLSSAITSLRENVAYESSKLNKIINTLKIPIGAFKHEKDENKVYCTSRFFYVLGIEGIYEKAEYIDVESFKLIIEEVLKNKYDKEENIYIIKKENQEDRWIKLIIQQESGGTFGIIIDVTKDILEKMKIEYDRDHDSLTQILNRRAFKRIVIDKIKSEKIRIAAIIMWDLDNLKFVNDTYGHEYGDKYICQAAGIFKGLEESNAVVARVSGDEFLVFMYGYNSKSEIIDRVREIQNIMKNTIVDLPNCYNKIKIRASAGIAWYPDSADNYDDLVKYADFAMYKIKRTIKGSIAEFDKREYDDKAFLINKKEDLNRLIEEQLIYHVFQPIVDAHKGEVYAYEILMRSKLESLKSPYQILAIAADESKLYEIERLTWFKGLEAVADQDKELRNAKIFINSLPNCTLCEEDINNLMDKYGTLFNRVVVELLENERVDSSNILEKRKQIKKCNMKIAIDDFGAGYSNETTLLEAAPDFVKIDKEIVREIHKDLDRQDIIKNLIVYTRKRDIKVIAEGIETREELEKLVELGVDYVQGYYISKPKAKPSKMKEDLVQEILDINNKYKRR
ncbi:EAL domain-containing protein [Clostridium paraputrificum]|uniref:EAL domain-containing protein n=2 Tax=Clostridium paraputrificum TaxID=29363 RepID=UPI00232E2D0A|nr:EAL domain-containing protein [Clostridium paraputrificum]MDB2107221.1 EAL domain-containing protein [Clostridium paraputrificum]MDB2113778.1 EAL domain-containing protein [Clostridium paraputrificum]